MARKRKNYSAEYHHLVQVPTIEPPTAVAYDKQGRPLGVVRLTGRTRGKLCRGSRRADGRHVVLSGRERVDLGRLIATIHLGPPEPGQVVMHRGDIKSDNRPERLAWGTTSDNNFERGGTPRLPEDFVTHVARFFAGGMSIDQVCAALGASRASASRIKNGKTQAAARAQWALAVPFAMPIRRERSRFDVTPQLDPDPGEASAAA